MRTQRFIKNYGLEMEAPITEKPVTENTEVVDQSTIMQATIDGLNKATTEEKEATTKLEQVVIVLESVYNDIESMLKSNQNNTSNVQITNTSVNAILTKNDLDPLPTEITDLSVTKESMGQRLIDIIVRFFKLMKETAMKIFNYMRATFTRLLRMKATENYSKPPVDNVPATNVDISHSAPRRHYNYPIYCNINEALRDSIRYMDNFKDTHTDFLKDSKGFHKDWQHAFLTIELNSNFEKNFLEFVNQLNTHYPNIGFDRYLKDDSLSLMSTQGYYKTYHSIPLYLGYVDISGSMARPEKPYTVIEAGKVLDAHRKKTEIVFTESDPLPKVYENEIKTYLEYTELVHLTIAAADRVKEFMTDSANVHERMITELPANVMRRIDQIQAKYPNYVYALQMVSMILFNDISKLYSAHLKLTNYVFHALDAAKEIRTNYENEVLIKNVEVTDLN